MNRPIERRNLPRTLRTDRISIQIVQPGPEGPGTGRVVTTETLDISRDGIRVRVLEPVEKDHYFDLCIELDNHHKVFLLTGEIRWCQPDGAGAYEAGILLHDGEGTDYDFWHAVLEEKVEQPLPDEVRPRA